MKKRGFAFIVMFFVALLAAIFLLIYTQRDLFFGKPALDLHHKQLKQEYLGSYAEQLKAVNNNILRYSGFKGALQSAEHGTALNGIGYWVVYAKRTPPSVAAARDSIGLFAEDAANKYLKNLDTKEVGGFTYLTNNINIIRPVVNDSMVHDDLSVDDGFFIYGRGSPQEATLGEGRRIFSNNQLSQVYPLRYWYVYRTLKKWVYDVQSIDSSVCLELNSNSDITEATIHKIINKDLEKLKTLFDENVACGFELECVNVGVEPKYEGWYYEPLIIIREEGKERHLCLSNTFPRVCVPEDDPYATDPKTEEGRPPSELLREADFVVKVSCTDSKYSLPVDRPMKRLNFNIRMHFSIFAYYEETETTAVPDNKEQKEDDGDSEN